MRISLTPYESPFTVERASTGSASTFNRKCIFCKKKISLYHGFSWSVVGWETKQYFPKLNKITPLVWIGPCCILKKNMYMPSYTKYGYVVNRKLAEQIESKLR